MIKIGEVKRRKSEFDIETPIKKKIPHDMAYDSYVGVSFEFPFLKQVNKC